MHGIEIPAQKHHILNEAPCCPIEEKYHFLCLRTEGAGGNGRYSQRVTNFSQWLSLEF